jgi:RHS repeat-associated protein
LSYILQYHLGSTSGTANTAGTVTSTIIYAPFGLTRSSSGASPTDKKFTGQRLDSTGLYYYGARYYDPGIGRFISPDTFVQDPANPQSFNRYSYCLNNPLKYTDPTGWWTFSISFNVFAALGYEGSSGVSISFDGYGNCVITNDQGLGYDTSVEIGANVQISYTTVDNVYDYVAQNNYTVSVSAGELGTAGGGVIYDGDNVVGGSFSVGVGACYPPAGLTQEYTQSSIIGSPSEFSWQDFYYGMYNAFYSPEEAYYIDYLYDGVLDYGYQYDKLYNPEYYNFNYSYNYDYGCFYSYSYSEY